MKSKNRGDSTRKKQAKKDTKSRAHDLVSDIDRCLSKGESLDSVLKKMKERGRVKSWSKSK